MHRRDMLKLTTAGTLGAFATGSAQTSGAVPASAFRQVARYDFHEIILHGPVGGNPFVDVHVDADFTLGSRSVHVFGFYDGNGVYKIRFMPDTEGQWTYTTNSNAAALDQHTGTLLSTPARPGVHGVVSPTRTHHFAHADGTPFFPFGTTCYAWVHQGDELERQTLETLAHAPFNKIRMCVFPKSYEYNHNEPEFYPFERPAGTPLTSPGDISRFNPAFFAHFEERLAQLRDLGIEADLILFHPYDRWGFSTMPAEADDRYARYVVARLSAFSNVWWSLANEFDLMKSKSTQDFTRLLHLVQQRDPCQHLRSLHYSRVMYDYASPAVTHASLQTGDFAAAPGFLKAFNKPVVYDEVSYEGDLPQRWGNLSGEEMTRRFWLGVIQGCYVTHGETFLNHATSNEENDRIWWSNGGHLSGTSPARIAFLRKLLEETTTLGLEAGPDLYYLNAATAAIPAADPKAPPAAILYYFDYHQPTLYDFPLGAGTYTADLIDPWAMTVTQLPGSHTGKAKIKLPAKPFQAVRFRRN